MNQEVETDIRQAAIELRDAVAAASGFQRFVYKGSCMNPILVEGDHLLVKKVRPEDLFFGDIVVYRKQDQFMVHRFLCCRPGKRNTFEIITKPDNRFENDNPFKQANLIGRVVAINKNGKRIKLHSGFKPIESYLITAVSILEATIFELMLGIKRKFFKNAKIKKTFRNHVEKLISVPKSLLLKLFFLA